MSSIELNTVISWVLPQSILGSGGETTDSRPQSQVSLNGLMGECCGLSAGEQPPTDRGADRHCDEDNQKVATGTLDSEESPSRLFVRLKAIRAM